MIRIATEPELMDTFRGIDREHVRIPANLQFPLAVKDYATWIESSGARVYLVYEDPTSGRPVGVGFQRTRAAQDAPPSMCQWCHTVRVGGGVGLLTADSSSHRRVGVYLCADLSCKQNVLGTPGTHDFSENLSGAERVQRIMGRMSQFARRNLF